MKKIWALLLAGVLLLSLVACGEEKRGKDEGFTNPDCRYEVEPNEDLSWAFVENVTGRIPSLKGNGSVNLIFRYAIADGLNAICDELGYPSFKKASVDYTAIYYDDQLACFLIEGEVWPTRFRKKTITFPICVSVEARVTVDPFYFVALDETFLNNVRSAAPDYAAKYTDEELKTIIESSYAAFTEEGILLASKTGDQLAEVPCRWQFDAQKLKDLAELKFYESDLSHYNLDNVDKEDVEHIYKLMTVSTDVAAANIATAIYQHTTLCGEDNPNHKTVSADGDRWTVTFENAQISFNKHRLAETTVTDAKGNAYTDPLIPNMDAALDIASAIYRHMTIYDEFRVAQFVDRDKKNGVWKVSFYDLQSEFRSISIIDDGGWGIVLREQDAQMLCVLAGA